VEKKALQVWLRLLMTDFYDLLSANVYLIIWISDIFDIVKLHKPELFVAYGVCWCLLKKKKDYVISAGFFIIIIFSHILPPTAKCI